MTEPIPFTVTRYRCPTCPRTGSSKARITEHMGRCWTNPGARGCKTCKHFEPYGPENADGCAQGVDLTGRRACPGCGGHGWCDISAGAQVPCNSEVTVGHIGDGYEVKPGPIVHCDLWEAALCCEFHDKEPDLSPRCGPDDQGGYCCDNCPALAAHQAQLASGETT
jgi:hypothetical protein